MTRRLPRDLAPLATALLLVVVMVGVASAVAKPAPLPGGGDPPVEDYPSLNDSSEEDYYYYYDDDYDYSEGALLALNMSQFHLPEGGGGGDAKAPHVPRYMLELYADQTSEKPTLESPLKHGLVRSFIATSSDPVGSREKSTENRPVSGEDVRIHSLSFNVSLPRREKITSATLRLYALITRDQYAYIGVERRVRIVMAIEKETGNPADVSHITVTQRDVYEVQNSWETFDVTVAVRYWLLHPSVPQVLQIHIESVFATVGNGGDLDVATVPKTDSEPLLLVYSKGMSHRLGNRELNAMIEHEYDDVEGEDGSHSQKRKRRRRRSTNEGGEEGRSHRSRRSTPEEMEEESNMIFEGDTLFPDLPVHAFNSLEGRRRPAGRKRRAKNSCKIKPLKVDFKDIGWDTWIIAPPSYEAYQCSGKCFYPLASHLSPTKHAVVQNLVHSLHPDRASRACCVPTKLGPISLLYIDKDTPTYEYSYNDMVVLECGCR